ncbi:hypothetical protein ARMGADRAFT_1076037 [Armillaria gallica]|uniref:Uncharacterized protein n=1 Tax=Armillaria gallica TaxID=47427 RepID=A0A2H3E348_ARMGA|nr:hypothetical protein ARMGADRAFT_1076037 [Armillaria gallica]
MKRQCRDHDLSREMMTGHYTTIHPKVADLHLEDQEKHDDQEQAADHERVWDGSVVEQDGIIGTDHDGSFSIDEGDIGATDDNDNMQPNLVHPFMHGPVDTCAPETGAPINMPMTAEGLLGAGYTPAEISAPTDIRKPTWILNDPPDPDELGRIMATKQRRSNKGIISTITNDPAVSDWHGYPRTYMATMATKMRHNRPNPMCTRRRQQTNRMTQSDDEREEARRVVSEYWGNEDMVKSMTREQLMQLSMTQMILVQEMAHIHTGNYNAEITTLLLGRDICRSTEEEVNNDEKSLPKPSVILSFQEQHAKIAKRLKKGKVVVSEECVDSNVKPTHRNKPLSPNPVHVKMEGDGDIEAHARTKPEPDTESPVEVKTTQVDIEELKNRIVLQRIRLSQIRDRIAPTVPDQGIIFDKNNQVWIQPEGMNKRPSPRLGGDREKGREGDNGDKRCNHCNPDGPPSDDDGSEGDDDKKPNRDLFTPRPDPWDASTTPSLRSSEAKVKYTEKKVQQIITFVRRNLGTKLIIADRLKGARLDVKSMKKYDGTPSHETYWVWLCSVIFAFRASQMGGPDGDEERLLILDSLLEEKAKAWFQLRLDRTDRPCPTFLEALIELYTRFIHESALQDTRKAFRRARWEDSDETV